MPLCEGSVKSKDENHGLLSCHLESVDLVQQSAEARGGLGLTLEYVSVTWTGVISRLLNFLFAPSSGHQTRYLYTTRTFEHLHRLHLPHPTMPTPTIVIVPAACQTPPLYQPHASPRQTPNLTVPGIPLPSVGASPPLKSFDEDVAAIHKVVRS